MSWNGDDASLTLGVVKIGSRVSKLVENIRCGGNDLRLWFYAVEWGGLGGETMFVLCGDEDHN